MSLLSRLYKKETKETIWSFATKGVAALLFFGLNIYLARVLGVELFGSWAFFYSNLTIVFLLSFFGLNTATRAFAAQHNHSNTLRDVLRSSLILRLLVSAVFALAVVLLHEQIAAWIRRPEFAPLFLSAVPFVFLMGLVEYLKQVFTGLHRLKYHLITNIFEHGLKFALSALFLSLAFDLQSVVRAHYFAVLAAVAAGGYFYVQFYRAAPPAREKAQTRIFLRRIFRYSMPLFFISIGFLLITEIDTVMLGLLASDYEVGLFAIGKQLANKLPQIALAMAMGTMPGFAQLNSENAALMQEKFRGILKVNAAIFLVVGAGSILFSPLFIPLIYGADYAGAVFPLQILTVWIVLSAFNVFFANLLDYKGRAKRRAVNFALTMAATIVLNYWLIPKYGAVGAAFSTTVAYIPYVILNGLEVRSVFREFAPEDGGTAGHTR